MSKWSTLATQRGKGTIRSPGGRTHVGLIEANSSSCNNPKLQSLVMMGLGPMHKANLLADELWLHLVGMLQLWPAVKYLWWKVLLLFTLETKCCYVFPLVSDIYSNFSVCPGPVLITTVVLRCFVIRRKNTDHISELSEMHHCQRYSMMARDPVRPRAASKWGTMDVCSSVLAL